VIENGENSKISPLIERLYGMGVCLNILENHKEDIECFNQALRIDQNSSKVWKAKASSF
jgi:hypothetical protein